MQSDDLGLVELDHDATKAALAAYDAPIFDQLTLREKMLNVVSDEREIGIRVRAAITAYLAAAPKDAVIERLVAERDEARDAYLPHQGRKGDQWSTEGYWDATIGSLFDDNKWHPQVWGKHRALHFSSVRQALAIGLQRAPECADVIACLIWSRELDSERTRFLLEDAARARQALGDTL